LPLRAARGRGAGAPTADVGRSAAAAALAGAARSALEHRAAAVADAPAVLSLRRAGGGRAGAGAADVGRATAAAALAGAAGPAARRAAAAVGDGSAVLLRAAQAWCAGIAAVGSLDAGRLDRARTRKTQQNREAGDACHRDWDVTSRAELTRSTLTPS